MKRIYKYFIYTLLGGTIASCDVLDHAPVNEVDSSVALTDSTSVHLALAGIYDGMQTVDLYALRYLYYQDVYADNMRFVGSFTTDNEVNSRRINPTNLQIAETWRAFYRVIGRANFILDALPAIDLTEERKNRISGEARFMRAFMYSEMAKVWGGVPIVEQAVTDASELNLNPKASAEELYNFMINDLKFAETHISGSNAAVGLGSKPFRASSLTASALLARVYLESGDYANAALKAGEVIDSEAYGLVSDFSELFNNSANGEMILVLDFTNNDQNSLSVSSDPSTSGQKFYVTDDFADLFAASAAEGDSRAEASISKVGDINRVQKYFRSASNDDDVPLIRLAEMYLIRAEANARQAAANATPATSVLADINVIRDRAGLSALTVADLATNDAALDEILLQRRFEFAFEGHRFADLKRFGKAEALFGPTEAYRVLWPIPFVQIEVNPNLVQNTGYSNS